MSSPPRTPQHTPSSPHPSPHSTSPYTSINPTYGWWWCKWTGTGATRGHYAALLLNNPINSTTHKLRVKFLDCRTLSISRDHITDQLLPQEITHITTPHTSQQHNSFFNMRREDWRQVNPANLPALPRIFPQPPQHTSGWQQALTFLLKEDSPLEFDMIRSRSFQVPVTLPHQVIAHFYDCCMALLTYIYSAPDDGLSANEFWRLRALFWALPKLLLRGRERLPHHAKLRFMTRRCNQFLNGEWAALWSDFKADRLDLHARGTFRQDIYSQESLAESYARAGNLGKAV